MSSPPAALSVEILVVGAGALGLCTAAELTQRGHDLAVLDPGEANASSVAAGMIAPALESAIDNVTPERAALLRRGAGMWPEFAAAHGIALISDGAEWRGEGVDELATRLIALGFPARVEGDRLHVPDDRRLEAEAALTALTARLSRPLITGRAGRIEAGEDGWRVDHDGGTVSARHVVLATGAATAVPGLPEAVAARINAITPIRGQIGRTAALLPPGVVRGRGAYAATGPHQSLIGATMEAGRRDLAPDAEAGRALVAALERIIGRPVEAGDVDWRAGVRGATPDGLPLAGAADAPGLFLALGPRRNGWLLAPLVARIVVDAIEACSPQADAAALDPLRVFQAQAGPD